MDYSKFGTRKKEKRIRSDAPKNRSKISFIVFRVFIFGLVCLGVMGISAGIGGMNGILDSAPSISVEDVMPEGYKSFIYDRDGNLQIQLYQPETNRIQKSISEMPEHLQNAFIALEDSRFREHNGIDPQGIVRAFVKGIAAGDFSEGASTITQQLLKINVFGGGDEDSMLLKFKRKFQEQYLAIELEKTMSKDQILEAYLNTINLGASNYGVEAASQRYFGKSCSDLTLSESAVLAGIAKSPTYYDPIYYPENNKVRREITLKDMLDQGYITEEEYNSALADDVYSRIAARSQENTDTNRMYTYYEDAAIRQVIQDLQDKLGYTEEQAVNKLYGGGLKVYLAQDNTMQAIIDEEYRDNSNFGYSETLGVEWACTVLEDDGTTSNYDQLTMQYWWWNNIDSSFRLLYGSPESAQADIEFYKDQIGIDRDKIIAETFYTPYALQSSFVLMDQHTGFVKAIAGGRNEKTSSLSFSRETQATRQPGSCFKILGCYLPGIDAAGMTLASTKVDEPYTTPYGYTPNNYDHVYRGATTVREAIRMSRNVVTTRFFVEEVGPELAIDYCRKLGITTLTDDDYVESLCLGGLTYGVTNLEITGAYAAIANNGRFIKPSFYTQVIDRDGNVILDATNQEGEQVIREGTAYLLTSAMRDVVTSGTGTACLIGDGMPASGKTGTTSDTHDLWFVGFTPYLTGGIWLGYDQNYAMEGMLSETEHEYLWSRIMYRVDEAMGYEITDFPVPDGVGTRTVCGVSGKLVGTNYCSAITELFDLEVLPDEYCTAYDHSGSSSSSTYIGVCNVCGGLATGSSPSVSYYTSSQLTSAPGYYCTCQDAVVNNEYVYDKDKESDDSSADQSSSDSSGTEQGSGDSSQDSGSTHEATPLQGLKLHKLRIK